MKNLLKSDLQVLAEKILNSTELDTVSELHYLSKELYEKLTVLKFVEQNLGADVVEKKEVVVEKEETIIDELPKDDAFQDKELISTLDENLFVSDEELYVEPATEKMIDIVAQMAPETQQVDDLFEAVISAPEVMKNDMETVTPTQNDIDVVDTKQTSLNDKLKKGITIGLNDRIAFVKHLFNGSTEDFNRVISQLNTLNSELEALEFLNGMVKPEYNNWSGKENYEERFLSFIEGKY